MADQSQTPAARSWESLEQNVYTGVYRALMIGMFLSTAFFAAGVLLALKHPAYVPLDPEWIRRHYHWRVVARGLLEGDPAAFMLTGTLLLILTPVSRVLISIYAFFADRDYKYAAVTGAVFLVMAATVLLSYLGLK